MTLKNENPPPPNLQAAYHAALKKAARPPINKFTMIGLFLAILLLFHLTIDVSIGFLVGGIACLLLYRYNIRTIRVRTTAVRRRMPPP
jgi:hypothetical protein